MDKSQMINENEILKMDYNLKKEIDILIIIKSKKYINWIYIKKLN